MEMVTELADLRLKTSLCFKELAFKKLPTNPETLAQPHPHYGYILLQLCLSVLLFILSISYPFICLSVYPESSLAFTSTTSKVLPLALQLLDS